MLAHGFDRGTEAWWLRWVAHSVYWNERLEGLDWVGGWGTHVGEVERACPTGIPGEQAKVLRVPLAGEGEPPASRELHSSALQRTCR